MRDDDYFRAMDIGLTVACVTVVVVTIAAVAYQTYNILGRYIDWGH